MLKEMIKIQLIALGWKQVWSIDTAVYHLATVLHTKCGYKRCISLSKQQAACVMGGVVMQTGASPFCTLIRAEKC